MRVGTGADGRVEARPGGRIGGTAVRAVNALTGRWAADGRGGTVFSAPGVRPLPAFLADGAAGPARTELSEALGLPAGQAAATAREVLAGLCALPGVDTAVGPWTERTLDLRPEWAGGDGLFREAPGGGLR